MAKTKKVLSDDAKYSRMENWLVKSGFPKDKVKELVSKYGMYAYDLMLAAQMKPYQLALKDGKPVGNTKRTIDYILNNEVSLDDLAKITKVDAATMKSEIATFNNEKSVPTVLPEPPTEVIEQQQRNQIYVEQRIDANAEISSVAQEQRQTQTQTASIEMVPGEEEWIEQELARMKGGKNREISFETLLRNGLTNEDMQNALTTDMVQEVRAGPKSLKLAENAERRERMMSGSGYCLSGVQYAMSDTISGFCYGNYPVSKRPGCSHNSACYSNQVWEQSGEFCVFKFKNDLENGNDCLDNPPPCGGAVVNFDAGEKTVDGHVCVSDGKGGYNCDIHQSASHIASGRRSDGAAYGDNFYISFTKDCTVSDELARKMLHERYMREHPNALIQNNEYTSTATSSQVTKEKTDSVTNVNAPFIYNIINGRQM